MVSSVEEAAEEFGNVDFSAVPMPNEDPMRAGWSASSGVVESDEQVGNRVSAPAERAQRRRGPGLCESTAYDAQARGGDAEERTRFFSLRFVSLRFVSLRFDSLRFDSLRFVSLRFVSLRFVSLRFVSLRFVSLRFDALSLSVSLSFSAVLSRHQQHHRSHTVLEKLSGRGHMRGGGGGGASAVQGTAGAPGEGKWGE